MIRWRVVFLAMSVALTPGLVTGQEQAGPRKSSSSAFLWSLGGTLVPWAVIVAVSSDSSPAPALLATGGIVVGPSLGHFYAGRPGRAWKGVGIRLGALAVITAGIASCFRDLFEADCGGGASLALVGSGLFIASSVYDIATAPASARRFNREHPVVGVVPVLRDGRMQVALVARVPF